MATTSINKVALKINFDEGIVDGKQKLKAKTISRVGKTATDDELFEAANLLGSLQTKAIYNLQRIETKDITA